MAYQAVFFCQDEKLARVLSQVFAEVDFNVDHAAEAFSTVKKLMERRYDAIVVDCDNEQNSTLIFKSARNSALNQNSLAIAVVEGQAGVARAYRIGASLVLTKPINVEHVKGTLRVARGLLRKNADAATTGRAAASAPVVSKPPASSKSPVLPAASAMPMASPASIPVMPALTASLSSPAAAAPALSKQAAGPALQEVPAASMSKSGPPKMARAESAVMTAVSVSTETSAGEEEPDALNDEPVVASAPARSAVTSARASSPPSPAKASAAPKKSRNEDDEEMEFVFDSPAGEPPLMSIYETSDDAAKHAPNRGKIFMLVMIIFVLLIAGYYAWSTYGPGAKAHPHLGSPPEQKVPLSKLEPGITTDPQFALLRIPESEKACAARWAD